jgi:hypothetical protein
MPQCQFPVFCCFCVSEKLHRKYSRNWTKQKPNISIFNEASRRPKRRRRGARGQPHHQGARPSPWPRCPMVRAPWSTSDAAPLPIKTPQQEKPKDPINFLETHRDPPRVHRAASPPGGAACPWPAPPCCEGTLAHLWRRPFAYKDPLAGKT